MAANCPSRYTCEIVSMGSSYLGNDVPALTVSNHFTYHPSMFGTISICAQICNSSKPLIQLDSLIRCCLSSLCSQIRSGNKPMVYLDSLIHCREWLAGSTTLLIADRVNQLLLYLFFASIANHFKAFDHACLISDFTSQLMKCNLLK